MKTLKWTYKSDAFYRKCYINKITWNTMSQLPINLTLFKYALQIASFNVIFILKENYFGFQKFFFSWYDGDVPTAPCYGICSQQYMMYPCLF